MKKTAK